MAKAFLATTAVRVRAAAWPALLGALLLLALLFLGHRYCTWPLAFNSDDVFPVEVCQDLLGRGYELENYHLPSAPYVFPDMLLLLVAVASCKGLFAIFLTYNCLYHGLLLTLLTALLRHTGLRAREAFAFACSGLLFLVVTQLDGPYEEWAYLLFHPGNHAGAILVGLLLALVVVANLHRRMPLGAGAAFVLAGGLGLFSDRLLLPQFLAPLVLTAALLAVVRRLPFRKAAETAALAGGACAAGLGMQYAFAHCVFVLLPLSSVVDLGQIRQAWARFCADLPSYAPGQHVLQIAFITFLPAAALVILRHLRRAEAGSAPPTTGGDGSGGAESLRRARVATAAVALIALLCCLCNLGALVLSGAARFSGTNRYLLGAVFMPFLFLGFCCRCLPGRPLQALGRACPALIAIFACVQMGLCHREGFSFRELRQPYPETARVLDRLARQGKIERGLATYWNARRWQYLTREHVPILTMHADGDLWLHSRNPNAFLGPGRDCLRMPRYNFLLVNEHDKAFPQRREQCELTFGTPAERIPAGECEVWIYDGLLNSRLGLVLRSALAQRCRRVVPYIGPSSPAALARPASNFAGQRACARVALDPGGQVKVEFPRPIKGALLDVGAWFNDQYDLSFYRGEELLTTLSVPRVDMPALSCCYAAPGLQSRLLTLPRTLREREWTSVLVRARQGAENPALGHFLVYPELPPGLETRQAPVGGHWRFEAQAQPGLVPGPGAVIQDSAASGGRSRFVPGQFTGFAQGGPKVFLDSGRYRVDFFIKAEAGNDPSPIAQLEVVSGEDCRSQAARALSATDFEGAGNYQKFSLLVETEIELSNCQFRVVSFGKIPLYIDRIELVRER